MTNYEYKSIVYSTKFRSATDTQEFDQIINNSAAEGWEFVTATSLATNLWDHGKTSGILLTFRREKSYQSDLI